MIFFHHWTPIVRIFNLETLLSKNISYLPFCLSLNLSLHFILWVGLWMVVRFALIAITWNWPIQKMSRLHLIVQELMECGWRDRNVGSLPCSQIGRGNIFCWSNLFFFFAFTEHLLKISNLKSFLGLLLSFECDKYKSGPSKVFGESICIVSTNPQTHLWNDSWFCLQ